MILQQKHSKALFYSVLLSVFSSQLALCQKIKPGVLIGMTKTQIDGFPMVQDFGQQQTNIGLLLGGLAKLDLSKKFQLEWQLRFSGKGMRKGINPETNDYTTWKVSLNYMEAPLILTVNVWKRLHFGAGVSIGGIVSKKIRDPYGVLEDSVRNTIYNRYELSYVFYFSLKLNQPMYFFTGFNYSILPITQGHKPVLFHAYGLGGGEGFYNLAWNFGVKYHFFEREKNKKSSE